MSHSTLQGCLQGFVKGVQPSRGLKILKSDIKYIHIAFLNYNQFNGLIVSLNLAFHCE